MYPYRTMIRVLVGTALLASSVTALGTSTAHADPVDDFYV